MKMCKKICIISTGGTILGSLNDNGYTSAKLDFKDVFSTFLNSEFSKNIDFEILKPFSVGSQDMSYENLLILMQTIKQNISQNDAIIITHGTDTMEESAFLAFLLFHKTKIPIIFCAAMYPPKHLLFDGEKNLHFAIISSFKAKGVFVAMNENLIPANEAIKLKSVGTDAFVSIKSLEAGILKNSKNSENSKLNFLENSENSSPKNSENSENSKLNALNFSLPKSLANVVVIYADSTFEPFFESEFFKNIKGIVVVGMGAGTLNKNALEFFESLQIPVVRASRCALSYIAKDGELAKSTMIPSFYLSAPKAKILLSLAISNGASKEQIQKYFEFFA